MRTAENIGALSHKMDATEHDIVSLRASRRQLRQLERVAPVISIFDNLVALVVMPQDNQSSAQFLLRRSNAPIQLLAIHLRIIARNTINALRQVMSGTHRRREQRQDTRLLTLCTFSLDSHKFPPQVLYGRGLPSPCLLSPFLPSPCFAPIPGPPSPRPAKRTPARYRNWVPNASMRQSR